MRKCRRRRGREKGGARKARINSSPAPMHLRPHLASRWSQKCIRRRDAPTGRRSPRYLRFSDLGNRRMLFLVIFFSLELSSSAYARSSTSGKEEEEREMKGRSLSSEWTLDFADLHSNDVSWNKLTSVFTQHHRKIIKYFRRSCRWILLLFFWIILIRFFFFREIRACASRSVCSFLHFGYFVRFYSGEARLRSALLRATREDFEYFRGEKKAFYSLFGPFSREVCRHSLSVSHCPHSYSSLSTSVLLVAKIDGRIGPPRRVFWYVLSVERNWKLPRPFWMLDLSHGLNGVSILRTWNRYTTDRSNNLP